MKEEGIHEGCIEQIQRLYQQRLFGQKSCRRKGRIRIDDWEMRPDVQEKLQLCGLRQQLKILLKFQI
jgi:enoyl-[acyl-carrier protein] reductase/trans-2-enoyl-CoA reductase (NAD+)